MVESSTFSIDFIAMKKCTEHIMGLKIKLHHFGIDIDSPDMMLNDNKSAVKKVQKLNLH